MNKSEQKCSQNHVSGCRGWLWVKKWRKICPYGAEGSSLLEILNKIYQILIITYRSCTLCPSWFQRYRLFIPSQRNRLIFTKSNVAVSTKWLFVLECLILPSTILFRTKLFKYHPARSLRQMLTLFASYANLCDFVSLFSAHTSTEENCSGSKIQSFFPNRHTTKHNFY